LREIPEVLSVAKDFEKLAPDAWLVNFINPTAVMGIALMRHSKMKSFALCDGNYGAEWRLKFLKMLDLLPEEEKNIPKETEAKLDMRIGGVNHCTFLTKFEYEKRDCLSLLMKRFRENAEKELSEQPSDNSQARYSLNYAMQLYDVYGAFPTELGHIKEYVPFFQDIGSEPVYPEPLMLFDANLRQTEMTTAWQETKGIAEGDASVEKFLNENYNDIAADVIENMWGGLNKHFFINSANNGEISNMSDDAFVELYRKITMDGPQIGSFGNMPRGLLALQQQVLDAHELTVEAAVSCDKQLLYRAMATDPIVNNLGDARRIIDELLEEERKALSEGWYK
jgi:alpha-galactosidase